MIRLGALASKICCALCVPSPHNVMSIVLYDCLPILTLYKMSYASAPSSRWRPSPCEDDFRAFSLVARYNLERSAHLHT